MPLLLMVLPRQWLLLEAATRPEQQHGREASAGRLRGTPAAKAALDAEVDDVLGLRAGHVVAAAPQPPARSSDELGPAGIRRQLQGGGGGRRGAQDLLCESVPNPVSGVREGSCRWGGRCVSFHAPGRKTWGSLPTGRGVSDKVQSCGAYSGPVCVSLS